MTEQVLNLVKRNPSLSQTRATFVPQIVPVEITVQALAGISDARNSQRRFPSSPKLPDIVSVSVTKDERFGSQESSPLEDF